MLLNTNDFCKALVCNVHVVFTRGINRHREVVSEVAVERGMCLGGVVTVTVLGNTPSIRVCSHPGVVVPPLRTATPADHLIARSERSVRVGLR